MHFIYQMLQWFLYMSNYVLLYLIYIICDNMYDCSGPVSSVPYVSRLYVIFYATWLGDLGLVFHSTLVLTMYEC